MSRNMTGARMVIEACAIRASIRYSAIRAGRCYPSMTRFSSKTTSSTFWSAMNRAPSTWPKATPARPGSRRRAGHLGARATNAVTGLTDALLDSIPLVVLTGQVPTFLIGTDGFQEADTIGITRPCTKHNWLIKDTDELAATIHKAFHIATSGRPGPVLIDIPKDVQFATGEYVGPRQIETPSYQPVKRATWPPSPGWSS